LLKKTLLYLFFAILALVLTLWGGEHAGVVKRVKP